MSKAALAWSGNAKNLLPAASALDIVSSGMSWCLTKSTCYLCQPIDQLVLTIEKSNIDTSIANFVRESSSHHHIRVMQILKVAEMCMRVSYQ